MIVLSFQCSISLLIFWVDFAELIFQNLVTNQTFGWELCVMEQNTFYLTKTKNRLIWTQNYVVTLMDRPGQEIPNLVLIAKKLEPFKQNLTKLAPNNTSSYLTMICKKNWKSRFFSRCKLPIHRLVISNDVKVLVKLWICLWSNLRFKSFQ